MTAEAHASPSPYVIRAGRLSDVPFVESSWCMSASHSSDPDARKAGYHGAVKARARGIFSRPDTLTLVACVTGDEDAILGWACMGPAVAHYCYVRRAARRQGIARALFAMGGLADPSVVPVVAYTSRPLYRGMPLPSHWTFNPNL